MDGYDTMHETEEVHKSTTFDERFRTYELKMAIWSNIIHARPVADTDGIELHFKKACKLIFR
jgi:hypothetical protein